MLSARTRAAYAADWALFTDHCAVTDRPALPADPHDGRRLPFLVPGGAGHPAAAGRRHRPPPRRPPDTGQAGGVGGGAGRARPAHRRTLPAARKGIGRRWRRRCAGCPRTAGPPACSAAGTAACWCCPSWRGCRIRHLAALTAGDIHVADGVATIRSPAGEWTLRPADDAVLCGPCAVTRWLKILDLAVTKPSTKTIARALKKAAAVDYRSPHVCLAGPVPGETTRTVPLLPPIDQWGALPLPLQRLSPHSLSRRARDLLAGDLGAHRDLPVDPDPEPEMTAAPAPRPEVTTPKSAYGAAEVATPIGRRREELEHLAGIIDVLTDVERRADELNRRAAELVEGWL